MVAFLTRLTVCFCLAVGSCVAQGADSESSNPHVSATHGGTDRLQNVPRVPGLSTLFGGFNAGITFAGAHDSGIGWYDVLTPAVSYTFSTHYSLDASASLFPYRLAPAQTSSPFATTRLVKTSWDAGDTQVSAHARFYPHALQTTTTAALTLPSGNRADGLSTGHVTFDFSEHVERYKNKLGILVDVGGGDSSALSNQVVTQDYSSLGALAHFQAGLVYFFPGRSYLQSLAYEQLPLGDQKIYTTIGSPNGMGPSMTFVTGRKVYEDNGFTTSVGIPLTAHITLSSYYNRSLRLHLDTVSTGLTFVWQGAPVRRKLSVYDKAFLEGERLLNTN